MMAKDEKKKTQSNTITQLQINQMTFEKAALKISTLKSDFLTKVDSGFGTFWSKLSKLRPY